MPKLGLGLSLPQTSIAPITTSRAFDSSGAQVVSAITGNIPSDWVPSFNAASVIFANNGSLIQIGSRALRNSPLTSVTIPNSVTIIGANVFAGCASLANAIIGNNVTTVSNSAFANCTDLISINVPNSVIIMGSSVFYGCTSLTSATLPTNINFTSINTFTFFSCTGLTSVTIPNLVTSIGAFAFYGCTSLPSVTIPNLVTSIGNSAFFSCTGLTSVTIPNLVTSIGNSAFRNSTNLASVNCYTTYEAFVGSNAFNNTASPLTIHVREADDTWTIGSQNFQGNSNVTVIKDLPNTGLTVAFNGDSEPVAGVAGPIPFQWVASETTVTSVIFANNNSVTSIGDSAFQDCSSLPSITIPNSVTSIGQEAFRDCDILASATLPTNINFTSISDFTFFGCYGLTSIIIPNTVTSIGFAAFSSCTGLTSITIPGSVASIASSVFGDCSNLVEVLCYVPYSAFNGVDAFQSTATPLTIRVPTTGAVSDTWTALVGSGQTFQGNTNVTVIKNL